MTKKTRTKRLPFAPTRQNVLVSGSGQYVRLFSGPLGCHDVVFESSTSTVGHHHQQLQRRQLEQFPGNARYHSILREYPQGILQALANTANPQQRRIVDRVARQVQQANPPGRFLARRFGSQQWIGMNNEQILERIQNDLVRMHQQATVAQTARATHVTTTHEHYHQSNNSNETVPVSPVATNTEVAAFQEEDQHHHTNTTTKLTNTVLLVSSTVVSEFLHVPCLATARSRLSDYNQYLLQSMELYQVTAMDAAKSKARVTMGQVGLRCKHCAAAADGGFMPSYSTSFPGRLQVMEFNFFHMAKNHFLSGACIHMPPERVSRLVQLKLCSKKQTQSRGGTGIQAYLLQVAQSCGIQNCRDSSGNAKGLKVAVGITAVTPSNANAKEQQQDKLADPYGDKQTGSAGYRVLLADTDTTISNTTATDKRQTTLTKHDDWNQVSPEETMKTTSCKDTSCAGTNAIME
jgi:hypothetical protein